MEGRFWHLLSLKLTNRASAEELLELNEYLANDEQSTLKVELLKQLFASDIEQKTGNADMSYSKHIQRLSNRLAEPVLQYETVPTTDESIAPKLDKKIRKIPVRKFWLSISVAASLVLFVGVRSFSHGV